MSDETDVLLTVRDWLRHAVSRFSAAGLHFGHGTDNAFDEAAYLILHTLHLPPDRLDPFLDARLTPTERRAVAMVIRRRVEERLPAPYLTREAWLGGLSFYVDERVIVPRSYIAELLAEGLAPWVQEPAAVHTALDMCTGSGCLAILAAHAFPEAHIDAVDVSHEALEVAARNVADHGLDSRIGLVCSDVFHGLSGRHYDLILCNPPYVTAAAMRNLPAEYRHEPGLALAAGEDGMDIVRRLLKQAAAHLNDDGLLVVEVGHNRHLVEEAFPRLDFTWLACPSGEDKVFLLTRSQLPAYAR